MRVFVGSLCFGLTILAAVPASAGPVQMGSGRAVHLLPGQIQAGYRQNLGALRTEMLAQQQRDGGTLTAEHNASFQRRLDRMNDDYRRKLLNQNPLSVNADGTNVARNTVPTNWSVSSLMQVGTVN